ncbi:transcriptional regulator with XRE-family HTH domain [Rahnella sp. BIGb0603]|uniref:phage repressor protein CI n=1 Tax=Rahnella sp. BIGb0603 TaxID=2940612 RepID=UPI002166FC9D|nr:phage repressor protein CI [Rahnella sp. BIGb0603]MCS3425888.1 transcriptional regulator with XRE-family HTH domain [Rahnella sp. BIGb0603]
MKENLDSSGAIIERMLISYGVKTQKELGEKLEIPANAVSNWQQRGSVPGKAIIDCAISTGVDLNWLVNGNLTDARKLVGEGEGLRGSQLREKLLKASGGKELIRRIMDAYGFKTQTELGDYLGLSSGTISTWIRREFFPGEVVVTCALDTGAPLYWLATGLQSKFSPKQVEPDNELPSGRTTLISINKYQLTAGQLKESGSVFCDPEILPQTVNKPAYIFSGRYIWLADMGVTNIANGKWLIDLDGNVDVYSISRLPGNKLQVKNDSTEFQCSPDELKAIGLISATTEAHF